MTELLEKIELNFDKKRKNRLLVALSGGIDSMCLLDMLIRLKNDYNLEIGAFHLDHMLREDSIKDFELVEKICKKENIEFYGYHFNITEISKNHSLNFEMIARKFRYNIMAAVAKSDNYDYILTAHHMGDQVESVFLNMFRGSALSGLCAMNYIDGMVVRPLLNITKDELIQYSAIHNIEYRDDYTNFTDDYSRNKLRNNLFKTIENEYQHDFIQKIHKMINLLSLDSKYLEKEAEDAFIDMANLKTCFLDCYECNIQKPNENIDKNIPKEYKLISKLGKDMMYKKFENEKVFYDIINFLIYTNPYEILNSKESRFQSRVVLYLDIDKYKKVDFAIASRVLRRIFYKFNGNVTDISSKNIEDLNEFFINSNIGAFYKNKSLVFEKRDGEIVVLKENYFDLLSEDYSFKLKIGDNIIEKLNVNIKVEEIDRDECIELFNSKTGKERFVVLKKTMLDSLYVRNRRSGDYIRMVGMQDKRKKIKKIMNEISVPQHIKNSLPLIVSNDEVIWIVNYRKSFETNFEEAKDKLLKIALFRC